MKLPFQPLLLLGLFPVLLLAHDHHHHHGPNNNRRAAAPTTTTISPQTTPTLPVTSTDGRCGNGVWCFGSPFGPCCSREGFCGNSAAYCAPYTCDRAWGGCDNTHTYRTGYLVSTNGTCGGTTGISCLGSGLGACCSAFGQCGSSPAHCGMGCQEMFGSCDSVSTDGTCGGWKTCRFSGFGRCCSRDGLCGSTEEHCGAGCQGGRAGECNDNKASCA